MPSTEICDERRFSVDGLRYASTAVAVRKRHERAAGREPRYLAPADVLADSTLLPPYR